MSASTIRALFSVLEPLLINRVLPVILDALLEEISGDPHIDRTRGHAAIARREAAAKRAIREVLRSETISFENSLREAGVLPEDEEERDV